MYSQITKKTKPPHASVNISGDNEYEVCEDYKGPIVGDEDSNDDVTIVENVAYVST